MPHRMASLDRIQVSGIYLQWFSFRESDRKEDQTVMSDIFGSLVLIVIPFLLTAVNLFPAIFPALRSSERNMRIFESVSIFTGVVFTQAYISAFGILTDQDWDAVIFDDQLHTPVHTSSIPVFLLFCMIGLAGYIVLAAVKPEKLPPLAAILAIAANYFGIALSLMWILQTGRAFFLTLLPMNYIVIVIRLLNRKTREKRMRLLWGLLAFIPLAGIAIYFLKSGFTETADWSFSERIAPPSVDSHYLCTVAAQGHPKLVRPQRVGVRHGRRIVVNRQLSVANAFEQILEERVPKIHRVIRRFYDRHGYPLSRLIRTKAAADAVYIVMKPLEWFFLLVLYLVTADPEERIDRQYR